MKFEVKNRHTGETQFIADIECDESESLSKKLGLAVKWAMEKNVNLVRAKLCWADLSNTNLSNTDLSDTDLSWADLYKAKMFNTNLSGSDLSWANMYNVKMYNTDISEVNMYKTIM